MLSRAEAVLQMISAFEAMDENETREKISRPGFEASQGTFRAYKLMLLSMFGEHEAAAELALTLGDSLFQTNPGSKFMFATSFASPMRFCALTDSSHSRRDSERRGCGPCYTCEVFLCSPWLEGRVRESIRGKLETL